MAWLLWPMTPEDFFRESDTQKGQQRKSEGCTRREPEVRKTLRDMKHPNNIRPPDPKIEKLCCHTDM